VPRALARAASTARRHVSAFVELESVAGALGELVGATIELSARASRTLPARERHAEVALGFGATTLGIGISPELATALLSRVLGRSLTLERQNERLDPVLSGALAALAVEVARRSARVPVSVATSGPVEPLVAIDVTVRVDGKSHAAYVLVSDRAPPSSEAPATLGELGDVVVSLPVVIAVSLATLSELDALRPGSAWLPGAGAMADARGVGRAVLAAPNGERGASVDLTQDGRIVLREERVELAADPAASEHSEMAEANGDDTLTEAVLEAPVVVRVELGSVSMPASDWAKLRPGDVIETGQRVAEPVVLRIAGQAVARGDLVDVDGELGVRIRELVREKR
jgi:type III secretion system YscQ/HrcQ family protein